MKKLNQEFVESNYKIIKKISSNVNLIQIDNSKYILKKIIVPLSYSAVKNEHKYIKYLKSNNINVADILLCYKKENDIYELQEYIENDSNEINIDDLIKLIAKFHNASSSYNKNLLKQKIYKQKFKCRNFELEYLLLGFNEKYYYYPKRNLEKNYSLISKNNLIYIKQISKIYDECYNYFVSKYDKSQCIIHNDITSNNVILKDDKLYLIDFDLAIRSSVYVDFIDCVIKRYKTIDELTNNLNNIKNDIKYYIMLYNKYNNKIKIDHIGTLCMFILKIISFNLYVLLNNKNKQKFNDNLPDLTNLIEKIYTLYQEEV